jgi:SAM-dependent methyltransferase
MSDMQDQNQKSETRFFYADELNSGMYDDTIELVVPQYKLMHSMMLELLRYNFRIQDGADAHAMQGTILDIGSGTGEESISILREFPNVHIVALDLCNSMHEVFRNKYEAVFPGTKLSERVTFMTGDILSDNCRVDCLKSLLSEDERNRGYIAVISAFTIHHLTHACKAMVYQRAYEVLADGGIFLNGDLFKYQSEDLSAFSDHFDNSWIAKQFKTPDSCFAQAINIASRKRGKLSTLWLDHYRNANLLEPIENGTAGKGQVDMLRDAGFHEVGCPFRYWQVGILWAKK